MRADLTFKEIEQEATLFKSRIVFATLFVTLLLILLVARLVKLQLVDHEHFKTLSHNNRVKVVAVPPSRGLIVDRNGVVLAQNSPSFSLELIPEVVGNLDVVLDDLREIVAVSETDEQRFRRLVRKSPRFESVPLRTRLSEEEVAKFAVNRYRFPGVDIHARLSRNYPLGSLGVHVTGYVGRLSESDLQRVDVGSYRGSTHIGKTGIEQSYEHELHGRVGYEQVEINAEGRRVRTLERVPAVSGNTLHLTIDASLQAAAESALGEDNGAVVAMDPRSGAVLTLVSMPGFDPNLFVDGIDAHTYRGFMRSRDRPLFNRVLFGQYPPGSTVKPLVALAGLERNVDQARRETWCPGWYRLKGQEHKYRDWKKGGHGVVDLKRAIVESCDVYFYELAHALGIDRLHDFIVDFGLGARVGIDLQGETAGLVPSTAWKRETRNQPWYPGETLISGIGQGFMLTTPLQLASAVATLATRGLRWKPHVVERITETSGGRERQIPPVLAGTVKARDLRNWDRIIEAMGDVVHGQRGTARAIGVGASYRIAGKTGTSQLFRVGQDEKYDEAKVEKHLRDHGLFIAFAPMEDPYIAISVIVENGGSGSGSAAPVARKVMDHYLLGRPGSGERQRGPFTPVTFELPDGDRSIPR